MHKPTPTFYEPLPYYMTAMGMQGARFIENGTAGTPGAAGTAGTPSPGDQGNDTSGTAAGDEDKLEEPGKKALDAERKRVKDLEKQLREKDARNKELEDEKLSDAERKEKQEKERDAELEKLRRTNLRLTALAEAETPIPSKYQALVQGDTAEELEASAALVAELLAGKENQSAGDGHQQSGKKGDPVPGSGTGKGPDGNSFAAGQDLYNQRKKKN